MENKYKISFCIICMNRLHHLSATILKNIEDNECYGNIEFIILDYNSADNLEEWVKENLSKYILNKKLVYYKTYEPVKFSHSHAKNLAFKIATGDIVCNINADNYTGFGFAFYINKCFNNNKNVVLTHICINNEVENYYAPPDILGKVCVKKSDFLNVAGFDESMEGYGFEDYDFINRLEFTGIDRVLITNEDNGNYFQYVSHSELERGYLDSKSIKEVYVNYLSPWTSEFIIYYSNMSFKRGTVLDNTFANSGNYQSAYKRFRFRHAYSLIEDEWLEGTWKLCHDKIENIVHISEGKYFTLKKISSVNEILCDEINSKQFYIATHHSGIEDLLKFVSLFNNRCIMEYNFKHKLIAVNLCFGKAILYKNFNLKSPIVIQ